MAADTKLGALDASEDEVDEKVAVVQAPTVKNTIPKPDKKFSLDDFASDEGNSVPNVGTLHMGLPILRLSEAKDFVKLHPSNDYWTKELWFVSVPIKGSTKDSLHLINPDLAQLYLPSAKIQHFRLALASKPQDVFFLCRIPTRNLDNAYNRDNVAACEKARTTWTQANSRREEGVDGYLIKFAKSDGAFPEPRWPQQSINELVERAFDGHMITTADHPGLLRLIGERQAVE